MNYTVPNVSTVHLDDYKNVLSSAGYLRKWNLKTKEKVESVKERAAEVIALAEEEE